MSEVPWFTEPPAAKLYWSAPDLGHLHFFGPKGDRASVAVTHGPDRNDNGMNVWHIEVDGDVATVSPSIHYIGEWHSPNPVTFRLVESLE